jgi:hypothetical protein
MPGAERCGARCQALLVADLVAVPRPPAGRLADREGHVRHAGGPGDQESGRGALSRSSFPGGHRGLYLTHRPRVLGQLRVAGEEGDALAEGLGQQQTVEAIFVQRGKAVDAHRVLTGDGQLYVAVVEQPPAQQARLDAEVFPSQAVLDGDLPQAGSAEAKLVARVVQEFARRGREPLGLAAAQSRSWVSSRSFTLRSRTGPRSRLRPCG